MSLVTRKLVIGSSIVAILLLANFLMLGEWLDRVGVIGWAHSVRNEYLTGTTLAITVMLLVLLAAPGRSVSRQQSWTARCPVCDAALERRGRYCGVCGSRV